MKKMRMAIMAFALLFSLVSALAFNVKTKKGNCDTEWQYRTATGFEPSTTLGNCEPDDEPCRFTTDMVPVPCDDSEDGIFEPSGK